MNPSAFLSQLLVWSDPLVPRNGSNGIWIVFAASLSFGVGSGQARDFAQLSLVAGERVSARLVGITDRRVKFETAAGFQEWELAEVVAWGSPAESQLEHQVLLHGGSVLVGELVNLNSQEMVLATQWFGQVKVRRATIAGIVLRSPPELLAREQLQQRLRTSPRLRDSVWLANGDELTGVAETTESSRPGKPPNLHIGPAKTVTELENVVAIAFAMPEGARPKSRPPSVWIGLGDGTRIAVTLPLRTEPRVEFIHSKELKLEGVGDEIWEHVTFLQPLLNHVIYLSDQPVVGYKHIPFLSQDWQLGLDRNVLGGSLRSSHRTYLKGLGMHSTSRVAFNLTRKFRWLEADLAVDDAVGHRGAVIFRVFLGEPKSESHRPSQLPWKLAYESPMVRGRAAPLPIRIDLQDAERVALVVDFADRGDEGDHANWLNARLVP